MADVRTTSVNSAEVIQVLDGATEIAGAPPPNTGGRSEAGSQPRADSSVSIASSSQDSTSFNKGAARRMTITEEHNALLQRLPAMVPASGPRTHTPPVPGSLEDDHVHLIKRLEKGVKERDAMLKQERERARTELKLVQQRLANAEQREAETHNELLAAKHDQVALAAANRQLEELQRSASGTTDKLSSLIEAETLNQQKHTLLLDSLDAERRRRASVEAELDALRNELLQSREELARTRDELTRAGAELVHAREEHARQATSSHDDHVQHEHAMRAAQAQHAEALQALEARHAAELSAEQARLREVSAQFSGLSADIAQEKAHREELARSQAAARAAARFYRAEMIWAWNKWAATHWKTTAEEHRRQLLARVTQTWMQRPLFLSFNHWRKCRHVFMRINWKLKVRVRVCASASACVCVCVRVCVCSCARVLALGRRLPHSPRALPPRVPPSAGGVEHAQALYVWGVGAVGASDARGRASRSLHARRPNVRDAGAALGGGRRSAR